MLGLAMFTESMDNTKDTLTQTLRRCNRIRYTVRHSERSDGLTIKAGSMHLPAACGKLHASVECLRQ